jgi:hypothetical protein
MVVASLGRGNIYGARDAGQVGIKENKGRGLELRTPTGRRTVRLALKDT